MLGYEGLEVINPEGGTEDAEEEAQRGRWKQEVQYFLISLHFADESFALFVIDFSATS